MKPTNNRTLKSLALLALILISGFIILSVLVHITNPGINPVRFSLSRYSHTPDGYLLSAGLSMVGLAEFIIGMLLNYEKGIRQKWISILLFIMGITAFITAILPMDIEPARTIPGTIHIYAAGAQFVLFPVCALIYGYKHKGLGLRVFSTYMGIAAIIILPFISFTVFTENPLLMPFYGLLQKIYIYMIVSWLGVIASIRISIRK
jgi:hypothetical protein